MWGAMKELSGISEQSRASGRELLERARALLAHGPDALAAIPEPEDVSAAPDDERRVLVGHLRIDLYALAAIVAEAAVERARHARGAFPPYGLVRSMFSDFRVLQDSPPPVSAGDVRDFLTLGKGCIDTAVWHLDRHLRELRAGESAWMVDHFARLLALFRIASPPDARPRLRDVFSFVYGGLHFGTSVSVQLIEVMTRLVRTSERAGDGADIIRRSSRPAYQLAALGLDDVVETYEALQPPGRGGGPAGWMDESRFVVETAKSGRVSIGFADPPRPAERTPTWPTYGCPARISPAGARAPIGALWTWCVDVAYGAGLL